jgi:hypothetical protein
VTWEYGEIVCAAGQHGAHLAKWGREGWELAAMTPIPVASGPLATKAQPGFLMVFKRPALAESSSSLGPPALAGAY